MGKTVSDDLRGTILCARRDTIASSLTHVASSNSPHTRPTGLLDAQMCAGTYAYYDIRYAFVFQFLWLALSQPISFTCLV